MIFIERAGMRECGGGLFLQVGRQNVEGGEPRHPPFWSLSGSRRI